MIFRKVTPGLSERPPTDLVDVVQQSRIGPAGHEMHVLYDIFDGNPRHLIVGTSHSGLSITSYEQRWPRRSLLCKKWTCLRLIASKWGCGRSWTSRGWFRCLHTVVSAHLLRASSLSPRTASKNLLGTSAGNGIAALAQASLASRASSLSGLSSSASWPPTSDWRQRQSTKRTSTQPPLLLA